jgi:hypothetical protein
LDASAPTVTLAGEREARTEALRAAEDGRGQALVVRDEAGLGKTSLLQHAIVSASGFQVATAFLARAQVSTKLDIGSRNQLADAHQHSEGALR